jgi:hypothetical protein
MKKLILTTACIVAASGAVFAQGNVNWGSISFSFVTASTVPSVESPLYNGIAPGGATASTTGPIGSYYYELLYSASATSVPTTVAQLDAWSDSGLEGANSANAGRLDSLEAIPNGGSVATTVAAAASGTFGNSGATVAFGPAATEVILVGWSANIGNTWAAASAVLNSPAAIQAQDAISQIYFGFTGVGNIVPASTSSSPGTTIFGTAAGQIKSLATPLDAVNAVPEPTTLALGAMGALSLLALRRKKA